MAVTGIGLMSGGLDSMLAAKLLMDQGVEVVGVSFTTPFFGSLNAEKAAEAIGFPLLIEDITTVHLEVVKDPPSGYGANMNPCIDCHALMVQEAGRIMDREGWDFIFTGEVLNERPMSQTRSALNRVANLSGYPGLVLRPLSALCLETGTVLKAVSLNISVKVPPMPSMTTWPNTLSLVKPMMNSSPPDTIGSIRTLQSGTMSSIS